MKRPLTIRVDKDRFEAAFAGLPDLYVGAGGFLLGLRLESTCPNPHCANGIVRGTAVGCAVCQHGERSNG